MAATWQAGNGQPEPKMAPGPMKVRFVRLGSRRKLPLAGMGLDPVTVKSAQCASPFCRGGYAVRGVSRSASLQRPSTRRGRPPGLQSRSSAGSSGSGTWS